MSFSISSIAGWELDCLLKSTSQRMIMNGAYSELSAVQLLADHLK
jgi:hypothetical protein